MGRVPLGLSGRMFPGLFCLPGIPWYVCCFLPVLAFRMDCGRIGIEGGRSSTQGAISGKAIVEPYRKTLWAQLWRA